MARLQLALRGGAEHQRGNADGGQCAAAQQQARAECLRVSGQLYVDSDGRDTGDGYGGQPGER